jgi:hypothetical protein
MEKHVAKDWMVYANLNAVIPTGRIAGYGLQTVVSGRVRACCGGVSLVGEFFDHGAF